MKQTVEQLEAERERLYAELSEIGDFRRGSIAENYRRCGKHNCACADEHHGGHGPRYLLMTKVSGRSRAQQLALGPELDKARHEVANHQKFRHQVRQLVEINEQLCSMRPGVRGTDTSRPKKKSLKSSKKKSHARSNR